MSVIRNFVWIGLLLLSGCVSGPTAKQISAFGDATDKAVSLISVPDELQSQLVLEATVFHEACRYLGGVRPRLAQKSEQDLLDVIVAQKRFSQALSRYAKAVAAVADPGSLNELRSAAGGFTSAISNVAAVTGAPPAVLSPIVGGVTNLAVNIGEIGRANRARKIMAEVYPYLIVAERLLESDVEKIDQHLNAALDNWTRQADCILVRSRREPATASTLFVEFDRLKRTILARKNTLGLAVDAMREVKEAHLELIESEGDLDQRISELNRIVSDAQAIVDAFEG